VKLQIAYDFTNLATALEIAKITAPHADILEIGSMLLLAEGFRAVRAFKDYFPDKSLCADTKLIEHVADVVKAGIAVGTDYFTVLAGAPNPVIQATATAAHSQRAKVILDLVDSPSTGQSAMDASTLEIDIVLFHRSSGPKTIADFQEEWQNVRGNTNLPIFITGKFDRNSIKQYTSLRPAGIVLGHVITQADDPAAEAAFFKSQMLP
jgi:3-keto-L-gulonate-6-phosphate decarboxylase